MTSKRPQRWQGRLLAGLSWFVALEFVLLAPLKFFPDGALGWPPYPEKFEAWGFPSYMSYVVGAGELVAGLLLMVPRRRFLGAVMIAVTLIGATVTHVINHDRLTDSVSAPIHLTFAVIIALASWPTHWWEPLAVRPRPAAVHPLADHAVVVPHKPDRKRTSLAPQQPDRPGVDLPAADGGREGGRFGVGRNVFRGRRDATRS